MADFEVNTYKYDDMGAFGRKTFRIKAPKGIDPELISKIIFQSGPLSIVISNPTFPYEFSPTAEQTAKLDFRNPCYLKLFDSENRGTTYPVKLNIIANKQVVFENCDNKKENTSTQRRKMINND